MKTRFVILFLYLVTVSCAKDDADVSPGRGTLVEATEVVSLTKSQVVDNVTEFTADDIALYDVSGYRITYRSEYEGKPIDTRGMLFLPKGVDAPRMLAYFHGTLLPVKALVDKEVPSLYRGGREDFREVRTMGLTWASAGYAVFLPDYIGYGLTEKKEHPYVYYPEMFKSNLDGLLAARQFMTQQGYAPEKRLFITGWSQGGGACLSAHKYIQENHGDQFTVVASSGLAGPYNFTGFVKSVFEKKSDEQGLTFVVSWGLYSLNKFSGVKRPADQIWSYPVPGQAAALLPVVKIPEKVFNNVFIAGILNGKDQRMIEECNNNSFHQGWLPTGKVFLHHGDKDKVVPYFNSVDAFNGLKAQGADIKIYTYPDGDHDTELDNFVRNTLSDFNNIN